MTTFTHPPICTLFLILPARCSIVSLLTDRLSGCPWTATDIWVILVSSLTWTCYLSSLPALDVHQIRSVGSLIYKQSWIIFCQAHLTQPWSCQIMSFSITVFILEAHQDTTLVAAAVVHTKHLPSLEMWVENFVLKVSWNKMKFLKFSKAIFDEIFIKITNCLFYKL